MIEEIKQWGLALSGFLTPTIAFFAVYIGWRQFQTARTKLRLDLFEKRHAVYLQLARCLEEVVRFGDANSQLQQKFLSGTRDALFLFDSEISDFIDTAHKHLCDLNYREEQIKRTTGETQQKHHDNRDIHYNWIQDETKNIQKRFEPWLGFAKVK